MDTVKKVLVGMLPVAAGVAVGMIIYDKVKGRV